MEEQDVLPDNLIEFPLDRLVRFLRPYEDLDIKLGANKDHELAIHVVITMSGGEEYTEIRVTPVDSLRPLLEMNGWTKP